MPKKVDDDHQSKGHSSSILPWIFSGLIFVFWLRILSPLLPSDGQHLGHDWAQHLPNLMAGVYFWVQNSPFDVPWFTPGFCGGIPFYGDPNVGYYALPQFLSFWIDPLKAIRVTYFSMAFLGFLGTGLLLRRGFLLSQWAALFGASLFLFHGFFAHRLPIGHLTFHAFPLLSVALWACLEPANRRGKSLLLVAIIGALGGYMVHAGMSHVLLPAALSGLIVLLMRGLIQPTLPLPFIRIGLGLLLALGLGASKVTAGLSWLRFFPRDDYKLPGFDGFAHSLAETIRLLFVDGAAVISNRLLVNTEWALGRHELEYGLSWVALLPLFAFLLWRLKPGIKDPLFKGSKPRAYSLLVALLGLCLIPTLLNTYTPTLNALWKSVPILSSSSSLLRFMAALALPLAILSATALSALMPKNGWAAGVTTGLLSVLVLTQLRVDRGYYQAEDYEASLVVQAWHNTMETGRVPVISAVNGDVDTDGDPIMRLRGNERMFGGESQFACYQAVFGYRLEHYPIGDLAFGPIDSINEGHFNLKNPACYLYPDENECRPGDHIAATEGDILRDFAAHKSIPFKRSVLQRLMDWLSLFSLLICLNLGGIGLFLMLLAGSKNRRQQSQGPA